MSRDNENGSAPKVDPAELETRVVLDDDVTTDSDANSPAPQADAATVLAGGDDRTELVTPPPAPEDAPDASEPAPSEPAPGTRVLDANEAAAADDPSVASAAAETRVLDVGQVPEDKTSPPRVAATPEPGSGTASADPDGGLKPGMVLFGEYEIVNVLGVGGMG